MAGTFSCLDYHIVCSTKYRRQTILEQFREELYQYVGGIIRTEHGHLYEIGGMPDHVHLLVGIPPRIAVSDMIRVVKTNSSKWVNQQHGENRRFGWQTGYGAFSVSASQSATVRRYIQNQPEHHRQLSFEQEYLELLERHGVAYDLQYVFDAAA
jgi:REP element-mobilizing transposase RayT